MATILDKIVASKRREIEEARHRVPARDLEARLANAPAARDFQAASAPVGHSFAGNDSSAPERFYSRPLSNSGGPRGRS